LNAWALGRKSDLENIPPVDEDDEGYDSELDMDSEEYGSDNSYYTQ
jgi:hypothetical protein